MSKMADMTDQHATAREGKALDFHADLLPHLDKANALVGKIGISLNQKDSNRLFL